ncbi:MAG: isochorismatase family cysteine hydrolase, partial [candidate division WOR-3 bacterium]
MKYEVKERVELSAKETALIIVDMQNDFAHERGSLFVPDAPKTIKPIKSLIEKFREKNSTIIYTQDWHMEDDPEFKIWGVHAVAGTWGAEIVDELRPTDRDITVKKLRYDAFYGTSLDHILRVKGIKSLVITGTVANICVLHTAGSAAL